MIIGCKITELIIEEMAPWSEIDLSWRMKNSLLAVNASSYKDADLVLVSHKAAIED